MYLIRILYPMKYERLLTLTWVSLVSKACVANYSEGDSQRSAWLQNMMLRTV
jgi:hypothetical protein